MSESQSENLEAAREFENIKKKYNQWIECCFSIMSDIYTQGTDQPFRSPVRRLVFYGMNLYTAIILASIITSHNLPITNWVSYNDLWLSFEFSRIDVLCSELYLPQVCIIISYAFYSTILSIFLMIFLLRMLLKRKSTNFAKILWLLLKMAALGNYPFFVLLSLTLKYSYTHSAPIEYDEANTDLDLSVPGVVLSVFFMILISGIGYCGTVFDYDIRHSSSQLSLRSKAYSSIEINSLLCNYCSFLLFTFYSSSSFVGYRIVLVCMHGSIAIMYRYYLPYYNLSANFIRSSCHVVVCFWSTMTLLAYFIDSAVFCIYALCIILPRVLYLWYSVLIHRESSIQDKNICEINDIWEFELIMRKQMINFDENKAKEIFHTFKEFYTKNLCEKPRLLLMWEASFCFHTCKNEQLAFFKLSQGQNMKCSLEEDFQEYILRKIISPIILQKHEEYVFVSKLYNLEKLKKRDKRACILALKLWKNLNEKGKKLLILENDSRKLKNVLDKLKNNYSSLIEKFPDSAGILELYISFLSSFYNDREKCLLLTTQRENIIKFAKVNNNRNKTIFQEECPLFLVSASTSTIGKIVFANSEMCDLLKYPLLNLLNSPISNYFPDCFTFLEANALEEFKYNAYDSMKYIEGTIPLIDMKGYLIEASVTCILFGSINPLYLFVCKPIENSRITVVITKLGVILYYSENFVNMLVGGLEIKGRDIHTIFNINLTVLKQRKNVILKKNQTNVLVEYTKITIKDIKLRFLYFNPDHIIQEEEYKEEEGFDKLSVSPIRLNRVSFDDRSPKHISLIHSGNLTNITSNIEMKAGITQEAHSTNSVTNPLVRRMSAYSDQSIKTLQLFKLILFISVRVI